MVPNKYSKDSIFSMICSFSVLQQDKNNLHLLLFSILFAVKIRDLFFSFKPTTNSSKTIPSWERNGEISFIICRVIGSKSGKRSQKVEMKVEKNCWIEASLYFLVPLQREQNEMNRPERNWDHLKRKTYWWVLPINFDVVESFSDPLAESFNFISIRNWVEICIMFASWWR